MQFHDVSAGWYRITDVYTSEEAAARITVPRIYLSAGPFRVVHDGQGRLWHGIKYPDPTKGGIVWVRLRKIDMAARPCRCPLYRFPHKRVKKCTGDHNG